jgi:hypothetical protein
MLRRVALVRIDVSEECIASIIRVTRIGELLFLRSVLRLLVTANVVSISPILLTLMMEAIRFSGTSVLTRATGYHIPDDDMVDGQQKYEHKTPTELNSLFMRASRVIFCYPSPAQSILVRGSVEPHGQTLTWFEMGPFFD